MKKNRFLSTLIITLFLALLTAAPAFAKTVCKIGSKGYPSLQEAVNNVKDGETIKVTKAIKATERVQCFPALANKFTIDFKNKKYTYRGGDCALGVPVGKKVTIKNLNMDADTGLFIKGTLQINSGKFQGGRLGWTDQQSNGKLVIKGGTFQCDRSESFAFFANMGTAEISGGTFIGYPDNTNVDKHLFQNHGKGFISGGTWTNYGSPVVDVYKGEMTISGGTFKNVSEDGTASIWNRESLTIKGGTFRGVLDLWAGSDTTITKGTVYGTSVGPTPGVTVRTGRGEETMVKIKGGTFKGLIEASEGSTFTLSGGKGTDCIISKKGSVINIKKFTVNQKVPNPRVAAILVSFGKIVVSGGSFTSPDGVGYCEVDEGKVIFKGVKAKSLFHVKELT